LLCYRCGTHVVDTAEKCTNCGQQLSGGGLRQATGTFSRRRAPTGQFEGAPYAAQDLVANRYLIKEAVGAGPLGFVFRAHDKEIDVEVALKVINPRLCQTADERKQFAKHLRNARKLSHPNLVRVYEEGEENERPFFTSQFLDGLTLRKIIDLRLQKDQFFAVVEIEPILAQVCAALSGAHKLAPHSDIKPENVLVLPDLLKVTDFGLGMALPRLPFVQAMKARKTDRYLAPEFIEGSEIDGRADIYSVGVIFGEMLSGLFPDGAIPEISKKNPAIPQAVEGIYRKAVNANPNARYKTVEEFMGELAGVAAKMRADLPPSLPKIESAVAAVPGARPRSNTGMLQLQPRAKPPPPVDMPPLPPTTDEHLLPDMTQPVDPAILARALKNNEALPVSALDKAKDREETEVLDSGMFIAQLDKEDNVETKAFVETVAPPSSFERKPEKKSNEKKSSAWLWVGGIIALGVALGAVGGYYFIQKQKPAAEVLAVVPLDVQAIEKPATVDPKPSDVKAPEIKPIETKTAETKPTEVKSAPDIDKAEIERIAAERIAAMEKVAAEKAAQEKIIQDKLAADRAASEKLAAENSAKANAEKSAAQKLAAEKLAAEKMAAEKNKNKAVAVVEPVAAGEKCPASMRYIQAGSFKMGTSPGDSFMSFDEKTLASVSVAAYCIDIYEYPNKRGAAPTSSVAFSDAQRICEAADKRLCTESEWEHACKGAGNSRWTYGNTFDANACNNEDDSSEARSLSSSGKFTKCRSSYGVADLSGNVAEWTAEKVVKGGSFASADYAVRCAARKTGAGKSSEVGFRCCSDAK
jgi:eukaryotic-like serine/threonine-protein kinase